MESRCILQKGKFMSKDEKSVYTMSADPNTAEAIIKVWLEANNYKLVNKKGEDFFEQRSEITGYRGFQYYISGNQLTINAWVMSVTGKFIPLDKNALNYPSQLYKNDLEVLFRKLKNSDEPASGNAVSASAFADEFSKVNDSKKETLCTIGFALSIVGLLLPFIGATYGGIIYILNIWFGYQGLKTKKRGMAIATIVITIVSMLLTILAVALSV